MEMSNIDKKEYVRLVFELEKQKLLLYQVIKDYKKKLQSFKERLSKEENEVRQQIYKIQSKKNDIDEEKRREDSVVIDDWIMWIYIGGFILWIILSIVITFSLLIEEEYSLLRACICGILGTGGSILIIVLIPTLIMFPCYNKQYKIIEEKALEEHTKLDDEIKNAENDYQELKKINNQKYCEAEEAVNSEISCVNADINSIGELLDRLYAEYPYLSDKYKHDFSAIAAIKHYHDVIGDITERDWRLSLLHGDRVIDLRTVQHRLDDFEAYKNEVAVEIYSLIEEVREEYDEEIVRIMQGIEESQLDMNETINRLETKYRDDTSILWMAVIEQIENN